MQKGKILIILGILLLVGAAATYLARQNFLASKAGLLIESEPESTVFIDDVQVGTTPFSHKQRAGEVVVKLVPFAKEVALTPYETKLSLAGGIETVLRRVFGPTEANSLGEILSFEKLGGRTGSLAVVSSPDSAQVEIDGKNSGFTPLKIDPIGPGDHTLKLNAAGYQSRELSVKVVNGFRLTVLVKLAEDALLKSEGKTSPETEGQEEQPRETVVEILTTPTGFLRVRAQPSTAATESARVTPGKKYKFLEEKQSWFKIEYLPAQAGEESKNGWVSAEYAKKVEE